MNFYSTLKQSEIVVGKKYWTCSYSGKTCVTVLKVFKDTNCVLVITGGKKAKPFVRQIQYIFEDEELCRHAGRQWEHDERKRKRDKKNKSKD